MANALTKLLGDAPLRRQLGQAARARVMDLFTLDGCLDAYRRAYPVARAARLPGDTDLPGNLLPGNLAPRNLW